MKKILRKELGNKAYFVIYNIAQNQSFVQNGVEPNI